MTSRNGPLVRISLMCGIVSSLLYVAMNVFVAMQWESYSSASQTVSELSAIGAPTRPLWVTLAIAYTSLVAAFGWGVLQSAGQIRTLRIVGWLIVANALLGLAWPPMHQREVLAAGGGTLTDTLHIVWTVVTNVLFMLQIGCAAVALGKRFRFYSIATMVMLVVFGALTGMEAPGLEANLPTPLIGVWERIGIGVFMLWISVLAIALLRARDGARTMKSLPSLPTDRRRCGVNTSVIARGRDACLRLRRWADRQRAMRWTSLAAWFLQLWRPAA